MTDYNTVYIHFLNYAFARVTSSQSIERELWEYFSFKIEKAHFNPKVKAGVWDGIIRLYNLREKTIYFGLKDEVKKFCEDRNYTYEIDFDESTEPFSIMEAEEFISSLNLPDRIKIRDYQLANIAHAIREKRLLSVSSVNSGKSLVIYSLIRYYNKKTLLIVPSKQLVEQFFSDFKDYSSKNGWNVEKECSRVTGDYSKENLNKIVISTWQSIYKLPKLFFKDYKIFICDEVHEAKGSSCKSIFEKMEKTEYRYGFTGTLDDLPLDVRVLTGLIGQVKTFIRTRDMIDRKFSSDLTIKSIILEHPDSVKSFYSAKKNNSYGTEIDYIIKNKERNKFIINLAFSLKGNCLIFYNFVDSHGKLLYDIANDKNVNNEKIIKFVHGDVSIPEREKIRQIMEENSNVINICSFGTYKKGLNIINIDYLIFALGYSSKNLVLQSIGRGLRRGENNTRVTLFDIADNLGRGKRVNHTMRHLSKRLKLYLKEGFSYKIYKVKVKT